MQTYQSMSKVSGHKQRDKRNQELEHLHRMVRDLELEVRGRRRQRNRDEQAEGSVSVGGSHGEASRQSSFHQSRDYLDRVSASPERRRPRNATPDAMSRALR